MIGVFLRLLVEIAAITLEKDFALLEFIGFNGTGSYLDAKTARQDGTEALRDEAIGYNTVLDDYNNNMCY